MPAWTVYQWEDVYELFMAACEEELADEVLRRLALLMELGSATRMPTSRKYKTVGGLFEFRANTRSERARFLYCFQPGRKIVLLECVYKTDQIPKVAVKRAAEKIKLLKGSCNNVVAI